MRKKAPGTSSLFHSIQQRPRKEKKKKKKRGKGENLIRYMRHLMIAINDFGLIVDLVARTRPGQAEGGKKGKGGKKKITVWRYMNEFLIQS